MNKSYLKVNYLLRLKKQIERKMIIETFQYLGNLISIKDYLYFGFGSVYFADYILFHKYLHISKMISIDNKYEDEIRFKFNKPFGFIDFKICECNAYLQRELDWQEKLLLWLDYDTVLDETILNAIEFLSAKVKSADIFLITIEAEAPTALDEFIEEFQEYIPASLAKKDIKKEFTQILNSIILTVIQKGLRNQSGLKFLSIFNIFYKDTKKMYTFGGIFCDDLLLEKIQGKIYNLPYVSKDNSIISIDCPILTPKEKMIIDAFIPKGGVLDKDKLRNVGIGDEEIDEYCKYYKYYPQFFESIY
jgi:hypothetical protein